MTEPINKFSVVVFKVGSVFSFGGTGYVIQEVLRDKEKRSKTYFRLLLGLCATEFIESHASFCGTWCTPSWWIWWGASGTQTSCKFQGFLNQVSVGSSMYSASLALYYLLSIRYNIVERNVRKYAEPWMHVGTITWCLGTAIAILFLDVIRPLGTICYIGRTPPTCKQTYQYGYTDCIQGDNTQLYLMTFFYIWFFIAFIFTLVIMVIVWRHVRQQENRMVRYDKSGQKPNRSLSARFATQATLYVVVLWFCNMWTAINFIRIQVEGSGFVAITVIASIFKPLEGFFNFLIYIRPRYLQASERRKRLKRQQGKTKLSIVKSEYPSSENVTNKHQSTNTTENESDQHDSNEANAEYVNEDEPAVPPTAGEDDPVSPYNSRQTIRKRLWGTLTSLGIPESLATNNRDDISDHAEEDHVMFENRTVFADRRIYAESKILVEYIPDIAGGSQDGNDPISYYQGEAEGGHDEDQGDVPRLSALEIERLEDVEEQIRLGAG